jgi:hypothetical protein
MNLLWGNAAEIQRRNRRGEGAWRSRTALDLHYMVSFYGDDAELEPQRLLGSVIRTLTDQSSITKQDIIDTLDDANLEYLVYSDLPEKVSEISFAPLNLTLDEISKIWSVFFQTPYCLSIAYKATVVMIEGDAMIEPPLPVAGRQLGGMAPLAGQPQIKEVIAQAGRFHPINAKSTLRIRGKYLDNPKLLVRLGAIETAPSEISESELILPLNSLPLNLLSAGVQTLQVVYPQTAAQNGTPAALVESNGVPFMLRPTIQDLKVESLRGTNSTPRRGQIELTLDLPIRQTQKVMLTLNEWAVENPATYSFAVQLPTEQTSHLSIPIEGVKSGEYLVRLYVDGAQTSLEQDDQEGSATYGWYIGPKVTLI